MSLSRSPSPVPGGGWASPGLNINSGRSSPAHATGTPVSWESAKLRNQGLNGSGQPSFSTHNQGFFTRHMRRISSSLPRFNPNTNAKYADKGKSGPGRWPGQNMPLVGRIRSIFGRMGRKLKFRLMISFIVLLIFYILHLSRECQPFPPPSLQRRRGF
jgi:mannan polymerase II complex MNN10 subunit